MQRYHLFGDLMRGLECPRSADQGVGALGLGTSRLRVLGFRGLEI